MYTKQNLVITGIIYKYNAKHGNPLPIQISLKDFIQNLKYILNEGEIRSGKIH